MSISPIGSSNYQPYGAGSTGSAGASQAPQDIKFSGYQPTTSSAGESAEPPKKSGGVKGFFKGMWNGAKNAVKSLATPKGLLMAAAGVAACIAFPVAAPLILGGVALAAGGTQIYKGVKNKDTEQIGGGTFTALAGAAGVAGARSLTPKNGAGAGTGSAGSEAAAAAPKPSFWSRMNPFKSTPKAEAPPALPPRPDSAGTSVSSKSAPLTEANLATHNRTPAGSAVGVPKTQTTTPAGSVADDAAVTAPKPAAVADDAGAATTTKPNMFSNAWGNLKNSGPAQNFSSFGSAVRNGEGVKGKLMPFAAPATMIPATASLTSMAPPPQEEMAPPEEQTA